MEAHSKEAVRNIYKRACTIHLTHKPSVYMAWAMFEEREGVYFIQFTLIMYVCVCVCKYMCVCICMCVCIIYVCVLCYSYLLNTVLILFICLTYYTHVRAHAHTCTYIRAYIKPVIYALKLSLKLCPC